MEDKRIIQFEVSEKDYKKFNNYIEKMGITKNEAFSRLVFAMAYSIKWQDSESIVDNNPTHDINKLKRRIDNWYKKDSKAVPKMILDSYLELYENNKCVTKKEMLAKFFKKCNAEQDNIELRKQFDNNFRLMCCSSKKAYGTIFIYKKKENDLIVLNKNIEKFILEKLETTIGDK